MQIAGLPYWTLPGQSFSVRQVDNFPGQVIFVKTRMPPPLFNYTCFKMADTGEEDLFAVFDDIETKKTPKKISEVAEDSIKDSVKRIFLQRGEKRLHEEDNVDAKLPDDGGQADGEKVKRAKKPVNER